MNLKFSSQESERTPTNSSDLVSEDTSSKKEQLVISLEKAERTATTAAFGGSSGELSIDENCQTSQNQNVPWENDLGANATECSSDENASERDHSEGEEYNGEELEISNLSDEDLENEMYDSEHSGIKINQQEVSKKCYSSGLIPSEIEANFANLHLAGLEEANNKSLLSKGLEEELYYATHEQNLKSDIPGGAKSTENTTESASTSKSIANVVSEKELLKKSLSSIDISLERVNSMDKSDATEVINPSSDFSDALGELSYSPTTRSSHAYDGSVSSYDGMDEYPGYPHSNPLYNTNSVADDLSDERLRMAKILADSMINGDSKAHQHWNISSDFPCENHHVMKVAGRKEFPSKKPFHYSGLQSVYDRGSPPSQLPDEPYLSSTSLPSDTCEDTDQEKIKLLRMIHILQDQLSRNSSVNGETSGRLSTSPYKGKNTLPYHSHELQEERFNQAPDYTKCNGRCNHGINPHQRHKLSLNPGSSEATSSTNHVIPSSFHCFPQEWQCPADLPPFVCQYEGPYMYHHHSHNCCSPHCLHSMNLQYTMNSKTSSLYSRKTKSEYHQRHQAYEARRYPREKQNLATRHVLPVAGGAPFITCQHCFKVLQLPADFPLKRAYRKLKCGSCSEVLNYSLMESHRPRELNNHNMVVNRSNQPSEPDVNRHNSSSVDPISFSDNYGLSASKSCSSEDPVSLSAFRYLHDCGYDHSVSREISEAVSDKQKVASSHFSPTKIPLTTSRSVGPVSNVFVSKKVSSQMDAPPPPPQRSSPLHRLMGYNSLSQVIKGGKSSTNRNIMVNEAANGAK